MMARIGMGRASIVEAVIPIKCFGSADELD